MEKYEKIRIVGRGAYGYAILDCIQAVNWQHPVISPISVQVMLYRFFVIPIYNNIHL